VRIRWTALAVAAFVSLITMPLTAIWFLFLGGVALGILGFVGAFARERDGLETPISAALGLLVGPLVYIGLGVLVS
jgi:hypothetical protein